MHDDYVGKNVSFEYIKYEINRNKPLAIRITDDDEFCHYVLLIGYTEINSTQTINYIDSRNGVISNAKYSNLANAIYSNSRWSHTYFIHPLIEVMNA